MSTDKLTAYENPMTFLDLSNWKRNHLIQFCLILLHSATVRERKFSKPNTMGAKSSSPRTVQLENDSPVSVIDVSDAVVDRLKGLHSRGLFHNI